MITDWYRPSLDWVLFDTAWAQSILQTWDFRSESLRAKRCFCSEFCNSACRPSPKAGAPFTNFRSAQPFKVFRHFWHPKKTMSSKWQVRGTQDPGRGTLIWHLLLLRGRLHQSTALKFCSLLPKPCQCVHLSVHPGVHRYTGCTYVKNGKKWQHGATLQAQEITTLWQTLNE